MPETSDNLKRVLVVDDDAGIRSSLSRILTQSGHEVRVAKDGYDAIKLARVFHPNLMLIDICMPGLDGVETLKQIRGESPSLAAIFMTAYSSSEKSTEAEDRGAISVLPKPLDLHELIQQVNRQ